MIKKLIVAVFLFLNCVYTIPAPAYSVALSENDRSMVGKSSYIILFGFIKYGNGSISQAMATGGVECVHHVDINVKDYFILKRITTVVVGTNKCLGNSANQGAQTNQDTQTNQSAKTTQEQTTQEQPAQVQPESTPLWLQGVKDE